MGSSPVVVLEFNELCPQLMQQFMGEGHLPNFQRLYNVSEIFITDAGENAPNLEPWIQWVTVHSGLPFSTHKIFDLGDGHHLKQPCIWDVLSRANRSVWICGSMNVRYDRPLNGCLLPDPWSTGAPAHPDWFEAYLKFVRASVHEHTNDSAPFRRADAVNFLRFMVTHGLSFNTVAAIVRQILSEKGAKNRWKRSTILDRLQFDVFRHVYRKLRPDFSTFFLNSTAHLQHMYWRNMEPALFKIQPSAQEQAEFADAILLGYRQMDDLLGRMLSTVGQDATVVFCTALSQQPCLIYDEAGGKNLYRPRDYDRMLRFAGVEGAWTVAPVMAEQFRILLDSEQDAARAETRLGALRAGDRPALLVKRQGDSLFSGCCINTSLSEDTRLTNAQAESAPFFEIFYQMEGIKSGMHQSDGMLWISTRERRHQVHERKASLTAIAPTILHMFGLNAPMEMQGEPLPLGESQRERRAAVA